jgi:hypothetical protein
MADKDLTTDRLRAKAGELSREANWAAREGKAAERAMIAGNADYDGAGLAANKAYVEETRARVDSINRELRNRGVE